MFPVVGGRKVDDLKGNIEARGLRLDDEEMDKIDSAYGFEIGFPHDFIAAANKAVSGPEDGWTVTSVSYMGFVTGPRPLPPY